MERGCGLGEGRLLYPTPGFCGQAGSDLPVRGWDKDCGGWGDRQASG